MLVNRWSRRSIHARSLIHSSSAKVVSADYQFYPTKMVKVNQDRAAAGIFNMVDTKTGWYTYCWWALLLLLTVASSITHSVLHQQRFWAADVKFAHLKSTHV